MSGHSVVRKLTDPVLIHPDTGEAFDLSAPLEVLTRWLDDASERVRRIHQQRELVLQEIRDRTVPE